MWDLINQKKITSIGNADYAVSMATFSPDGKRLATYNSSEGGSLRLWDTETGIEIAVLEGHDGVVEAYFSPTGRRLATHGWPSRHGSGLRYHDLVRLWATYDGSQIKALQGEEQPTKHVGFSPDGELFATASEGKSLRVWRSFDGAEVDVMSGANGELTHTEFSPDGAYVLSVSSDSSVRVWRVGDVNLLAELRADDEDFSNVWLNFDAERMIVGYASGAVALWDTNLWTSVATMSHSEPILCTAWSSDNLRVVTGSKDGTVVLWNAKTGQKLSELKGHDEWVRDVAFDTRDDKLISAGEDGTARVWDLRGNRPPTVLSVDKESVGEAFFLKDGRHAVTITFGFVDSDKKARLWDVATGALLDTFDGPLRHGRVGPDGNTLLAFYSKKDSMIRVWNLDRRREVSKLQGRLQGDDANVKARAFSPDGTYFVAGLGNGIVHLWEVETGRKLPVYRGHEAPGFEGQISSVAFSPEGKYIVTGSVDRTARLWDLKTGEDIAVYEGHEDPVRGVVFGPEGKKLITIGGDVGLWDAESGRSLFYYPKRKLGFIVSSYLAADGRILLANERSRVSIFNMFPSKQSIVFPTTSALVDHATKLGLKPLTAEERARFFLQ